MTTTIEPVPATEGALLSAFQLPDVSGQTSIGEMTDEQCAELAYDTERALLNAARLFAQICEPVRQTMIQAKARVETAVQKNGGKKIICSTFNVECEQPKGKEKDIPTLLQLHDVLPADVCDDIFSVAVDIKGKLSDETLAELRKIIPESMLAITVDANGTKLNALLRDLGSESEVGKIITAGYYEVPKGKPIVKFVPRESALKKAGAA